MMIRKTEQRSAIWEALKSAGRPLSVQEVFEMARKQVPGLGIATVYRNLRALIEEKRLNVVPMPGEASRYEVANDEHHHFFHCNECDRVYNVQSCPKDLKSLVPEGFAMNGHQVILYGQCPDCNSMSAKTESSSAPLLQANAR